MLNHLCRHLSKINSLLRKHIVIIFVFVSIAFIAMLLQPLIVNFLFRTQVNDGVELYEEEHYLRYDKGPQFQEMISEYSFLDTCEVLDFAYYDNSRRDTILYGKQSDFFVLELNASEEYHDIKDTVSRFAEYCGRMGDFDLYLVPQTSNDGLCSVFAFCEAEIIRVIFGNDVDQLPYYGYISRILFYQTTMNWDIKIG